MAFLTPLVATITRVDASAGRTARTQRLRKTWDGGLCVRVDGFNPPPIDPYLDVDGWLVSVEDAAVQQDLPIRLADSEPGYPWIKPIPKGTAGLALWLFQGNVYSTKDLALTAEDVRALVNVDANKRRLALEKAHALQAMTQQLDTPRQRERIPQEVRIEVWQRDSGRCVECGGQENLEFDHIIPFGMGGSNTARNLQLLCGDCNRRKGMTLG